MKIGDNIREIREKERFLKKEDVAVELGITPKAYANIENNVSDITITRLEEIARIFGCAPDYILNYHKGNHTYHNEFNNNDGNQGNNNVYQGQNIDQIKNLYEQLLEAERSKVALLESFLNNKK
jgi:transcriptional regulator with XRE-family HTH domain